MPDHELMRNLGIADDELYPMTPEETFVLGYEMGVVNELLRAAKGSVVRRPIHAANKDRIAALCKTLKRGFRYHWIENDASEDWVMMVSK